MVWSLEEEEGKESRGGGIRGGRGRQAGGMMGKEENAMRKWGEEEDKHAEDLAGSEEGTAGSFYNIRWISKFSDSSPHRLMDLPDGSHQRDHAQTTAGPGGYVHVYYTFEIKKNTKKKRSCFLRRQFTGSTAPAAAPSPPRLSTLTPAVSLPVSPAHLHSLVQNLVHMRKKASNIPDMFHSCRKRCNFGSEVYDQTCQVSTVWDVSGWNNVSAHLCVSTPTIYREGFSKAQMSNLWSPWLGCWEVSQIWDARHNPPWPFKDRVTERAHCHGSPQTHKHKLTVRNRSFLVIFLSSLSVISPEVRNSIFHISEHA